MASRSGGVLVHDNIISGLHSENDIILGLRNYRETPARSYSTWGIADGTSVWDVNATEADGTHVDGHPPYLFDSGTVTGASVIFSGTTEQSPIRQSIGRQPVGADALQHQEHEPDCVAYTLGSFCPFQHSNNAHLLLLRGHGYAEPFDL